MDPSTEPGYDPDTGLWDITPPRALPADELDQRRRSRPDPDYRPYDGLDQPLVDVDMGGRWYPGTLHAWRRVDGVWWGHVTWTRAVAEHYPETLPADRIRPTQHEWGPAA